MVNAGYTRGVSCAGRARWLSANRSDGMACRKRSKKMCFNLFGMHDTPRVPVSNFYLEKETGGRPAALPDHLIGIKRHTPPEGPDFVLVQPFCRDSINLYTAELKRIFTIPTGLLPSIKQSGTKVS